MSDSNASIAKHPCPECGGDLVWNPAKQALACPYCGTVVAGNAASAGDTGSGVVEQELAAALLSPLTPRGWGATERREMQCQSCHAISVFVDGKVAQRCEFCGSPAIIPHEDMKDAITPQSLLPFKLSDGQVRDAIRKWYGSRWFAPNRLKSAALTDTLHGVYLPYWTFDAHVDARWTAEAGYHYYVTETYRQNGQTHTRQVQKTRWEPAAGELAHFFDDALVAGTTGVHLPLLRQVEPFPTATDLKPYSPEFVRGWTVERYRVDLRKAAELNEADLRQQTEALCAQQVPGDTHRNLQVQATFKGRTFKHVLVPVWIVSYTYGSKSFQVITNGYTGAIAGERPWSWVKIFFAVMAALLALLVFVYVFGD
jgi:hypothetical protein